MDRKNGSLISSIRGFFAKLRGEATQDDRSKPARNAGQSKFVYYGTPQPAAVKDPAEEQRIIEQNAEILREYKKLLDDGVISREEYENKKKRAPGLTRALSL